MGAEIKKNILLLVVGMFLLVPSLVSAAVDLSSGYWETTYDCAEWTYAEGQPDCDTFSIAGMWTCNGIEEEQITSAANMAVGNGGRGQRHWEGDGININSGGLKVTFAAQPELWIRWYMRYQTGFAWSYLSYDKIFYMHTDDTPDCIVEFYGSDDLALIPQDSGANFAGRCQNCGWTTIMGGATSDGNWHCYEIHIKMDTDGTDGVSEWWVDGVLKIQETDVNWGGTVGSTTGWISLGIGSNQRTPNNGGCEAVDFDDIAISNTGYIGPISTPECSDSIDNDGDGAIDLADSGCIDANDNDETDCGDGVCEGGETCSSCVSDCGCVSPNICCNEQCVLPTCSQNSDCGTDLCKLYTCSNPGTCTASCSSTDITSCVDNDSCCPSGCSSVNDNDCIQGEITETWGDTPDSDHIGTLQDTFTNINDIIQDGQDHISTWSWSGSSPHKVANTIIIKADLSAIPSSAVITDAKLYLYQTEYYGNSQYTNTIHKIINKNPVISEVTGYNASVTEQWTAVPPGTTYNDVPLGLADIEATEDTVILDTANGYKTFSMISMVQDWVSNPSLNYGLLVNGEDGTSLETGRTFASTENSDSNIRPKLVVSYSLVESSCSSGADNNPVDGVVSITELMSYISQWKAGSVTITELMTGIGEWKNGC